MVRPEFSSLHPIHLTSFQHHAYDTQMNDNDKPDKIFPLLSRTADYFDDVKNWMTANKLNLNDDKTEAM